MPNIRKSLLQFVFAGAFMKRWNDKMRPMELLEVDKQAHKMIVPGCCTCTKARAWNWKSGCDSGRR